MKRKDSKYLSASRGYRDNSATQEVDDEIAKVQQKMSDILFGIHVTKSSMYHNHMLFHCYRR